MIFVPKKNIWFPRRNWGSPKFQRGIIQMATAALNVGFPPPFANAGSNINNSGQDFSACGFVAGGSPGASASGGKPPLTFQWDQTGAPAQRGPYNVSNDEILNPSFSGTPCDGDIPDTETWRLTVTDDDLEFDTDTITVTLVWINQN